MIIELKDGEVNCFDPNYRHSPYRIPREELLVVSVGEIFNYNGRKVRCCATNEDDDMCVDCVFTKSGCDNIACTPSYRRDKMTVVFKEVKDE